MNCLQTPADV